VPTLWKRQAFTLVIFLIRGFYDSMQFSSGLGVLFHLPLPIVLFHWIEQSGQLAAFFGRELVGSRLNLFYAIHVRSLSANQTLDRRGPGFHIMPMVDGKPAAYVCEHFTCKAPVTDPKQLAKLLKL
jgi:hypothetical protein